MLSTLRVYIGLTAAAAAALLGASAVSMGAWPHAWSPVVALVLLVAAILAEHLTFQVHRGWSTAASTVPHLASAFLLPPVVAAGIATAAMLVYATSRHGARSRVVFNCASVALAVGVAAHVATALGGPDLLLPQAGWLGPSAALLASLLYYLVSAFSVAGAVAIDQGRPLLRVIAGKAGSKAFAEIGLGLTGVMIAMVFAVAPGWTPLMLLPAGLVYLVQQAMNRADRRSRSLELTNSVGRAVAGSLNPAVAFRAISSAGVRDALKLDGLVLEPFAESSPFHRHAVIDVDQPELRQCLLRAVLDEAESSEESGASALPAVILEDRSDQRVHGIAVPFGIGDEQAVGALLAWRRAPSPADARFTAEELLVLRTLADYGAVALQTARLLRDAGEAEALRELAQLKDEFLGQVSHELRTPLTIIHGYAELITQTRRLADLDTVLNAVREIHQNSSLMLRVVDDLLDTSRIDSGRFRLREELVDVGQWLAQTTGCFAQTISTHRVVLDLEGSLGRVRADPARLTQVLNNLLTNAARYSPPESTIRVSARADVSGNRVEVRVQDRGAGIPPEEHERIFEKFYRGREGATLSVRGAGIGLAVAKALIAAHHGEIGVESAPGKGSTFWIRLALVRMGADLAEPLDEPLRPAV